MRNAQADTGSELSRLFRPNSIAVIGGGAWCTSVVEQCVKMGFEGPIWPIHPKRDAVADVRAFASLDDLPATPDATFIGVNRHATIDIVKQLSEMGAGGAVCFASGFREAQAETGDGETLQNALLAAAGDMPILGPNCYGFINYLDGALLWPDQHGGVRCNSGVAILTQSSNMAINLTMQARGLPLAYMVTAGNQAQQGLSEVGRALLADDRVTALGLHIEGIGDLRAFETLACEAHRLGKPIVAIKAGKSEQARAAAISHTASVAGSDAGARALLKRLAVAQVDSLPAFLETLKLLHFAGPLPSAQIISMSCSGGEASLIADSAAETGVSFPPLNGAQKTGLRAALGPMVALANPLDYHTFIWDDEDAMAQTFTAALSAEIALGCLVVDFPRADRCDPVAWDCTITAGAKASAASGKPLAIVSTLPETMPETVAARIFDAGLIAMQGLDDTLCAISAAAFLGRSSIGSDPVLLPHAGTDGTVLTEAEAKAALAAHGVPIPLAKRASSKTELTDLFATFSCPVVLKAEGIAHKTEAGGVALNLSSADAVATAANAMPTDHFLIEEMVADGVVELLVGVMNDPAHGFVLTLAAGGTLTEVLKESQSLLVPAAPDDIKRALDGLRVAPLIHGYRGRPGANIRAIVDVVMSVQTYVIENAARLEEIEINPLICTPMRAIAADALIRTGDA